MHENRYNLVKSSVVHCQEGVRAEVYKGLARKSLRPTWRSRSNFMILLDLRQLLITPRPKWSIFRWRFGKLGIQLRSKESGLYLCNWSPEESDEFFSDNYAIVATACVESFS